MGAALSIRARLIGACLREYREAAQLDLQDAASVLGCDRSKVSRVEAGERGILPADLSRLLDIYDADPDERQALLVLAGADRGKGWWEQYRQVLGPGYQDILAAENAATAIMIYAPLQVPELLQSPEHARTTAAADPSVPEGAGHLVVVAAAMARQRAVLRDHGSRVDVVLGEAALRSVPGGDRGQRDQVLHLQHLATSCPRLTIRILTSGTGTSVAGGSGGFTVLRFSRVPVPGIVLADSPAGVLYVDMPGAVAAYDRAHAALWSRAPELPLRPGELVTASAVGNLASRP
jgi:transcriptional regulator with XRE-family HTH domain